MKPSGAVIVLALASLTGCAFGVPMKHTDFVPDQAARSATIRLGESTREDVRAALGTPWLDGGLWRVEAYRADDKRTELGFMVAIVVPVPVGVFGEREHGYVLVAYDAAGRVAQVSPGTVSEGSLARDSQKWMALRAGDFTLVVDPVRNKLRSTLIAEPSRLRDHLERRRGAADCTLVAACDEDHGCPDRLAIDEGEPFDPTPITVLWAQEAPCPNGSKLNEAVIDGKSFFRMPVLHAIGVAPGRHALRITSSVLHGGGEATFECSAGEVLYGIVRSRVEGASWWSKGKLQATVTFADAAPEGWDRYSVVLVRDGRWLASSE